MSRNQLFCFTYAGGTSSFYDELEKDLEEVELIKFEYAGHGTRHKENYYNSFDELADDLFTIFKKLYSGGDYSLLGYSMGSIALVEMLKRIVSSGIKFPTNIFLSAHEPQTKAELLKYSKEQKDEWVKERTIEFGAVPEKLIHNKVFWRTYLPLYRADYEIISKYDFNNLGIKVDVPTTVFYSETDTPLKDMKEWSKYFPCEFYCFEGNHFFIQQHHQEMADIIKTKIGV